MPCLIHRAWFSSRVVLETTAAITQVPAHHKGSNCDCHKRDSGGISCWAGWFIFAAEIDGHVIPSSTFKKCGLTKKSSLCIGRYIHCAASKCELAQRKWLGNIQQLQPFAIILYACRRCLPIFHLIPNGCFLQQLPTPNVKFGT